jgi:hypothetical protein
MLDPQDRSRFDRIVMQLRTDDPAFVHRLERTPARPGPRIAWICALLGFCLIAVVAGGWTGAAWALVVTAVALRLILRIRA